MTSTGSDLSGIRVWRGFRSDRFLGSEAQRSAFVTALKEIFIPQTSQQMEPIGLKAYLPAVSIEHDAHDDYFVPDEIALVVYENAQAYEAAVNNTVAGRAYRSLHGTIFNFSTDSGRPSSTSNTPQVWSSGWDWGQTYSLLDRPIDWHTGTTTALLAKPRCEFSAVTFYREVDNIVNKWLKEDCKAVLGGFLCVTKDWLMYWEHVKGDFDLQGGCAGEDRTHYQGSVAYKHNSLTPRLCECLQIPNIHAIARRVSVPPAFTAEDIGVNCKEGELLNITVKTSEFN